MERNIMLKKYVLSIAAGACASILGGLRTDLEKHGIGIGIGIGLKLSQFYQDVTSGGADSSNNRNVPRSGVRAR